MSLPANTVAPTQLSHPPKPRSLSTPTQPIFLGQPRYVSQSHRDNNDNNNYKPIEPVVKWTSSITKHCRDGRLADAAAQFAAMRLAGVEPNHVTFVALLSGCAHFPSHAASLGAAVHGYARKLGMDTSDVVVGTAIVDMYAKSGSVGAARLAFDGIEAKNSVSWNTMIDGYMRNGNAESAVELFDEMPSRDRVSWTALIGGFVKRGQFEDALGWFRQMQLARVDPDYVTVIAVLAACADLGAAGLGLWANRFVLGHGFKHNVKISNSLIDMYSRCGCIDFARQIFENMPDRTVVSWNSIIVGFAVNGRADEALEFFDRMQKEGFKPDGVSFTGALTACSHAGLVEKGLFFFETMSRVHGIRPRIEHYGCIVDLFSRSGRLQEALNVVKMMPMKPNEVVLGSLLAACRTHGDVSLAESVMNYLSDFYPGGDSNYVLLANIYAAVGKWDVSNNVRSKMKALGIRKTPGFSSIEIDCDIHQFVASDKTHFDSDRIYSMLELLSFELKASGYVPENVSREIYEHD